MKILSDFSGTRTEQRERQGPEARRASSRALAIGAARHVLLVVRVRVSAGVMIRLQAQLQDPKIRFESPAYRAVINAWRTSFH